MPPTGVLESLLAELDQPPAGRRILKPLSAAAAVVVLAAGGYGAASALGHNAGATHAGTQHAELTATGCTGLELAGGTLARTTGNDLVLTTISGNQLTVTTTSTTAIYREIIGTLAASTVEQDTVPAAAWQKVRPRVPATRSAPTMPAGKLPSNPPTKPFAISLNGLGCSPAAITTTYLLDGHL